MSFVTISTNMSLTIPDTDLELGPDWANDLNNSLLIVDLHNHTPGSGVLITPAAMSIDTDLNINQTNLTLVRSVNFTSQPAPLALSTDHGCIYESGVDLYFNDGAGNPIQLTQSGGVAGVPGSITNMTPPATASYAPVGAKFIWQSAVNTPAHMDAASFIFKNLKVNSFRLTLAPRLGLTSDYQLTLPALPTLFPPVPPVGTNVMVLNPSGSMLSITYDQVGQFMTASGANAIAGSMNFIGANAIAGLMTSTGANVIANTMTVTGANAIAGTMDSTGADAIGADMTATGANAVANSRTRGVSASASVGEVAMSSSSGDYELGAGGSGMVTNMSVTIATSGRPVRVFLIATNDSAPSAIGTEGHLIGPTDNSGVSFELRRDGGAVAQFDIKVHADNSDTSPTLQNFVPPSAIEFIDDVGASTYTYELFASAYDGDARVRYCKLVAYEL